MAHVTQTTRLWHPFAAMGKVDGHELVLVRGDGSRVWDAEGTEYIDATAGLWFANVGHGRAEIADAVAAQLRTLAAHHVFGDHANEPALELAARLADLAPVADAAVFFGTGGGITPPAPIIGSPMNAAARSPSPSSAVASASGSSCATSTTSPTSVP